MTASTQNNIRDFEVGFDNYHSTHSSENKALSTFVYQRLRELGHIVAEFADNIELNKVSNMLRTFHKTIEKIKNIHNDY